jgi:tRNA threonylcarbamoyl adenosine modification protein YeaZ/ribosomal-protein-alanine acetyltransferase
VAEGKSSPGEERWVVRERVNHREYNIAPMLLLALETVTRAGSLAICGDTDACASMAGDPGQTHGVRLPGEVLQFLGAYQRTLADVDTFVVVTGPGSFTGLRVGLATIQGFALARDRAVIGIPTLEAMVSGWLDRRNDERSRRPSGRRAAGGLDPVGGLKPADYLCACLDGARGDVFYVLYDVTGASRLESATLLIEPSVATPDVAAARVRAMTSGRQCTLLGDGVERYADRFRSALPDSTIDSPMPNLADAAARLARRRVSTRTSPHALRPIYIRRPDAELARDRAAAAVDFDIVEVKDPAALAQVAALQARIFADPWGADGIAGGDANRDIAHVHALRHRSGELIAYSVVWHVLDELHIQNIAVDPAFRRKGLAKALLNHVLADARAMGAASATLEVRASNAAARALYDKFGFTTEAVRKNYYKNPTEDALILWRRNL